MTERRPHVDLRLVHAFVLLAERRHYGRAAARLHVSVSALSQQIRRLEADLGLTLFVRSTRSVELTPAGELFRPVAQELLAAEVRSLRAIAQIRRSTVEVLRLGYLGGSNNVVPVLEAELAVHDPALVVETRRLDFAEQTDAVRDGRVDASFVRPPLDFTDLSTVPVWTEHRVVILPVGHPLAGRDEVHLDDIADEPIVTSTSAPREWGRWWTVDPRPDVVYIPLTGVEPSTVHLCWASDDRRPVITALLAALRQLQSSGRIDEVIRPQHDDASRAPARSLH